MNGKALPHSYGKASLKTADPAQLLKRQILAIILPLVVVTIIALPLPVLAVAQPDSTPSIQSIRAFRHLTETDDFAIIFHARFPYATYPTDATATESVLFRLYDTDGTTLLATKTPYTFSLFENNGYGDMVAGIWFDADDAPTWGSSLVVNIWGMPIYFDPPVTVNYTMASTDYSDATTQDEARDDMYAYVIGICDTFSGIYPDVALKATTDTATVLSIYGDVYFRGAVTGIQAMCPDLFITQVYTPEIMEVTTYTENLSDNYSARLVGTDIERGANRIADYAGVSGTFFLAVVFFALALWFIIWTNRKGWGSEPGLVLATLVGIGAALLIGDVVFTILMVSALGAAGIIVYAFIFKRA